MLTRVEDDGRSYDLATITRADLLTMTGGSAEQIAAIRRDLGAEVAAEGDEFDAALFAQWFDTIGL